MAEYLTFAQFKRAAQADFNIQIEELAKHSQVDLIEYMKQFWMHVGGIPPGKATDAEWQEILWGIHTNLINWDDFVLSLEQGEPLRTG